LHRVSTIRESIRTQIFSDRVLRFFTTTAEHVHHFFVAPFRGSLSFSRQACFLIDSIFDANELANNEEKCKSFF